MTIEQKVLATILNYPELLAEVPFLEAKHFPTLSRVFQITVDLLKQNVTPTPTLFPDELRDIVAYLLDEVPPSDLLELRVFAERLVDDWLAGEIRRLMSDATSALQSGASPTTVIARLENSIRNLFAEVGFEFREFNRLVADFVQWLTTGAQGDEVGLTNIQQIDDTIGKLRAGTLVTIVAPTGGGKTSFGIHIALQSALKGYPTAFVSLEMTERQLMSRVVAHLTAISSFPLWTRDLSSLTQQQLATIQSLQNLNIPFYAIHDAFTLDEVLRSIVIARQRFNCRLAIVDYIQKIITTTSLERRELEVASTAKELKRLALSHDVCIVALSQASSDKELRTRESRVVEHESDIILTLKEKEDNPTLMLVHLRKNRMGVGNQLFVVDWDAETCRFGSVNPVVGGAQHVP